VKRALLALLFVGCGYRPLYGGAPEERFAVVGTSPLVADAAVVADLEAGVRSGLAEAGALGAGREPPRVVVELVRIDERSEGIRLSPDGTYPLARGARIGVSARAWLEREPGGARERDTGDIRVFEVMAAEKDVRLDALRRADALRAASRRLGMRLAARILGRPTAPDEDR
jgi:hypothetical protein